MSAENEKPSSKTEWIPPTTYQKLLENKHKLMQQKQELERTTQLLNESISELDKAKIENSILNKSLEKSANAQETELSDDDEKHYEFDDNDLSSEKEQKMKDLDDSFIPDYSDESIDEEINTIRQQVKKFYTPQNKQIKKQKQIKKSIRSSKSNITKEDDFSFSQLEKSPIRRTTKSTQKSMNNVSTPLSSSANSNRNETNSGIKKHPSKTVAFLTELSQTAVECTKERLNELEMDLNDQMNTNEELKEQNETLLKCIDELEMKQSDLLLTITSIKKKLLNTNSKLEILNIEQDSTNSTALQEKLIQEKKVREFAETVNVAEKQVKRAEKRLSEMTSQKEAEEAEKLHFESRYKKASKDFFKKERELELEKKEKAKLLKEVNSLRNKLFVLEQEKEKTKHQNSKLLQTVRSASEKDRKTPEILQSQIAALELDNEKHNSEILELKIANKRLQNEIKALLEEKTIEEEIIKRKAEIIEEKRRETRNQRRRSIISELEIENNTLKEALDKSVQALENCSLSVNQINDEFAEDLHNTITPKKSSRTPNNDITKLKKRLEKSISKR